MVGSYFSPLRRCETDTSESLAIEFAFGDYNSVHTGCKTLK